MAQGAGPTPSMVGCKWVLPRRAPRSLPGAAGSARMVFVPQPLPNLMLLQNSIRSLHLGLSVTLAISPQAVSVSLQQHGLTA